MELGSTAGGVHSMPQSWRAQIPAGHITGIYSVHVRVRAYVRVHVSVVCMCAHARACC